MCSRKLIIKIFTIVDYNIDSPGVKLSLYQELVGFTVIILCRLLSKLTKACSLALSTLHEKQAYAEIYFRTDNSSNNRALYLLPKFCEKVFNLYKPI